MWNWLLKSQAQLERLKPGLSTRLITDLSHKLCDYKTQSQLKILKTSHQAGNPAGVANIERAANSLEGCLVTRKQLEKAFFPWLEQKTNE